MNDVNENIATKLKGNAKMNRLLSKWNIVKIQLLIGLMMFCVLAMPTQSASAGTDIGCAANFNFHWWGSGGGLYHWNAHWGAVGYGAQGEVVRHIQQDLNWDHGQNLVVDGMYGWNTYSAIRQLQQSYRDQGVTICGRQVIVDGVVGVQTWTILLNSNQWD